jgi:hypothetical protein
MELGPCLQVGGLSKTQFTAIEDCEKGVRLDLLAEIRVNIDDASPNQRCNISHGTLIRLHQGGKLPVGPELATSDRLDRYPDTRGFFRRQPHLSLDGG